MAQLPAEPGIYKVPATDYHSWDAASASVLKSFERSPAHARVQMLKGHEPTDAMTFGDAFHAFVLEPDRFQNEYAVAPKVDRRTKAGREEWAAFENENPGKLALTESEYTQILDMSAGTGTNPISRTWRGTKGHVEKAVFWHDEETGLACKCRPDWLGRLEGISTVVDLKTTRDASPDGFAREVARYGYHVQAAWYLAGLFAISPAMRRFLFVACEKEEPYLCGVYELDADSLELGRQLGRRYLAQWAEAKKSNLWAGYPTGITAIRLPAWNFKREDWEQW